MTDTAQPKRGGKPFQSILEPHFDFIHQQRQRRRTWREIADLLFTEKGIRVTFENQIEEIFAFSFLCLRPDKNQIVYLSCGYSHLWKIPALNKQAIEIKNKNPSLGTDPEAEFTESTALWKKGDCLILGPYAPDVPDERSEEFFSKIIQESIGEASPQKIGEAILRRTRLALSKSTQQRGLPLIGITHL